MLALRPRGWVNFKNCTFWHFLANIGLTKFKLNNVCSKALKLKLCNEDKIMGGLVLVKLHSQNVKISYFPFLCVSEDGEGLRLGHEDK